MRTLEEDITDAYKVDELATEIFDLLRAGAPYSKKITLAECEEKGRSSVVSRATVNP